MSAPKPEPKPPRPKANATSKYYIDVFPYFYARRARKTAPVAVQVRNACRG